MATNYKLSKSNNKKSKLYIKRKKVYYILTLLVFLGLLFLFINYFGSAHTYEDYKIVLEFDFANKVAYELFFEIAISIIATIILVQSWLLIYRALNYIKYNRNYKKNFQYMQDQAITYYICPTCGNQTDLKEVFCPNKNKCKLYKKDKGEYCFARLMDRYSKNKTSSDDMSNDQPKEIKLICDHPDTICVYDQSINDKHNFFECKYIDKCNKKNCYFKSNNNKKFHKNADFNKIEGEFKQAINAYLDCEHYRKYQKIAARIRCLETSCKYHLETTKDKKPKKPCTLSNKNGVTLGPNIMYPKKLKCRHGKRINLLFERNIINVGDTQKNKKDAKLCIVCNGSYKGNGQDKCYESLQIHKGINFTIPILGLPNSGKTSYIMNVFHILKSHVRYYKNTSTQNLENLDLYFDNGDEDGLSFDYKEYISVEKDDEELVKNTLLKKTNVTQYVRNFSFSFTDGSYTFNFSDRPGEAMRYASVDDTEDSGEAVLKYTMPDNYNGVIIIYNPYMSSGFKANYAIDSSYYDDTGYNFEITSFNKTIYDMVQFSEIVNKANDYLSKNKKIAFVFQKTDLFFDVEKITGDAYKTIIFKNGNSIKIGCDEFINDSMIIDDRNKIYKIQLLEYEIGTFCIRNVQALLYKLKHGISIDENYDMLMNFKTGKFIISVIFAYIFSMINDSNNAEWQNIINEHFIRDIEDKSSNETRITKGISTNQEIIDYRDIETKDFAPTQLFVEEMMNNNIIGVKWYKICENSEYDSEEKFRKIALSSDARFYSYLITSLVKELFMSCNENDETSEIGGLPDPDKIMNLAGVIFCLVYGGTQLMDAFIQRGNITSKEEFDQMIKLRRFFTTNAYYRDFAKSKISSKNKLTTELFINDSNKSSNDDVNVINVDNRTINPVVWILDDEGSSSCANYVKQIMSNNGKEGWK